MSQCKAELRSRSGGLTMYCILDEDHDGDHFNEGPLTWWFDDRAPSPVTAAGASLCGHQYNGGTCELPKGHDLHWDRELEHDRGIGVAWRDRPAPTSAVPGLREAVAGYRDRQVALRDGADKARKREAKARHIGAVAALDCVLDEIDRRSPAPADGGGRP